MVKQGSKNNIIKDLEARIEVLNHRRTDIDDSRKGFEFKNLDYVAVSKESILKDPDFKSLIDYIDFLAVPKEDVECFKMFKFFNFSSSFDCQRYIRLVESATSFKYSNRDFIDCFYPLPFVKLLDIESQLLALTDGLTPQNKVNYKCPLCSDHRLYTYPEFLFTSLKFKPLSSLEDLNEYKTIDRTLNVRHYKTKELRTFKDTECSTYHIYTRDAYFYFLNNSCSMCHIKWNEDLDDLRTELRKARESIERANSKKDKIFIPHASHHSHLETYILDIVRTFYKGVCIQGDRKVLKGKELDLYFPDKNIAIEICGDYFHKTSFTSHCTKPSDYHLNKCLACKEKGIILVTIFDSCWELEYSKIKSYLIDLFSGKENDLSFCSDGINLNYPPPDFLTYNVNQNLISEHTHTFKKDSVYECGIFQHKIN